MLYREVTAKLVFDRCVGVEHTEKGRSLKDQRSNSLLPPTLIPWPLSLPPGQQSEHRNNPGSRGKRSKSSTLYREAAPAW